MDHVSIFQKHLIQKLVKVKKLQLLAQSKL